jgi:hypothetical protein
VALKLNRKTKFWSLLERNEEDRLVKAVAEVGLKLP